MRDKDRSDSRNGMSVGRCRRMREVLEEYGRIIIATVASILLIGFAAVFLTKGQVFEAILLFSQSIC